MRDHLIPFLEPLAQLFDVKSIEAMGLRVLGAALILLVGFWISRVLHRFLVRRIQRHDADRDLTIEEQLSYCTQFLVAGIISFGWVRLT